jgi:hypothetical protein
LLKYGQASERTNKGGEKDGHHKKTPPVSKIGREEEEEGEDTIYYSINHTTGAQQLEYSDPFFVLVFPARGFVNGI